MAKGTYRVIQWATGAVGQVALRQFAENPAFDLVGVLVTNPEKVGKDAGALTGIGPTGVIATDDVEAIVALDADCVHFAPLLPDVDMICRLLRSGKNVVTPLGPFYPTEFSRKDFDRIEEACREGGTSFHGSGIHPGFAGDLLPLVLARLAGRINGIRVYEIADFVKHPTKYIEFMGFGRKPHDWMAKPSRSPDAPLFFAQSMAMVAERLGKQIEKLTTDIELATATKDIPYATGIIPAGTVAGQHYAWTAWVDGAPLIVFHVVWTMGDEDMEPRWDYGDSGYLVAIDGDPPSELVLRGGARPGGGHDYPGLPWTALAGVNVIPEVCDAKPGVITHLDLGVPRLHGLVRRP
jgi:hypothetical protein